MDTPRIGEYLSLCAQSDGGFGVDERVSMSDVESTYHALRAYQHLGASPASPEAVLTYLRSLFDAETGLFASSAGAKGSVQATAYVFASLDILQELQQPFAVSVVASLKAYLEDSLATSASGVYFNFGATDVMSVADIHAGVLLGSYVDFPFAAYAEGLIDALASLQNLNNGPGMPGAFAASSAAGSVASLEASHLAVATLVKLGANLESDISLGALFHACRTRASGLNQVAAAHAIVALTGSFSELVQTQLGFSALNAGSYDGTIIQGTQFKPFISVRALDGVYVGGLEVEVLVSLPGRDQTFDEPAWSPSANAYVGHETVDTAGVLGRATFEFTLAKHVPGIGHITWSGSESSAIGYGLEVTSNVEYAGRTIEDGETLGEGAALDFAVRVHNIDDADLRVGDFEVTYSLIDASGVSVYTSTFDASSSDGSAPIAFAHNLENMAIPSGSLTATFTIGGAEDPHSTSSTEYAFVSTMVASAITVNGKAAEAGSVTELTLGSTLSVSMEPGTLADMTAFVPFEAAEARVFALALVSDLGVVAQVTGSSSGSGKAKVDFELPIPTSLELVGEHRVAFVYVDAKNALTELDHFGMDDAEPLAVSIPVNLEASKASGAPKSKSLSYGDVVDFGFVVVDTLSGEEIGVSTAAPLSEVASETPAPGVYLVVSHGGVVSVRVPAEAGASAGFAVEWTVSPNAVAGEGKLEIAAYDGAGNVVPVHKSGGGKVEYPVVIGGDISVTSTPFTESSERNGKTVFVAEFDLACNGKKLAGAQLRSIVSRVGSDVAFEAPVAIAAEGDAYQVSWVLPVGESAGTYVASFFREVDAAESDPMFEIEVNHAGSSMFKLPVKTQFIGLVAFASVFYIFVKQRYSL